MLRINPSLLKKSISIDTSETNRSSQIAFRLPPNTNLPASQHVSKNVMGMVYHDASGRSSQPAPIHMKSVFSSQVLKTMATQIPSRNKAICSTMTKFVSSSRCNVSWRKAVRGSSWIRQ